MTGVFFEPGAVFADIAARGRWWLALLIMMLLASLSVQMIVSRISYDTMIQKIFDSNERIQQLSADQRAQAVETQRKIMPITMRVMPLVGSLVGMLVIAAALMFTFKFMLDAELTYKNALNITCYAMVPVSIVSTIATIAVLYLKAPEDFDIQNPIAFNLGAFLPDGTAKWLASLAGSIDLFTIWAVVLIAIGFSAFCGARKMPFGRAITGVLVPWAVYVVGKAAFASIFG